jgi:pimeloyl-ACP methyl ester carboxylesterase
MLVRAKPVRQDESIIIGNDAQVAASFKRPAGGFRAAHGESEDGMKAQILLAAVAAMAVLFSAPAAMAADKDAAGIWQGKLTVQGGISLRLVVHIARKGDALAGSMDSPDQGAKDIPVSKILFEKGKLTLTVAAIAGTFEGAMNDAGTEIAGTWKQGAVELPLTLARNSKLPDTKRPQDPVKPYPYDEEEVSYANPKATGVSLAGTLTLPKGDGPYPAVLLITGSGPQDRNEELLGHRPFLVIADYLTRRGIAVLRVDDRGIAKSTGNFATATSADFATDVMAGLDFLKKHKRIDPAKIGLIGHSEGGLIAPMVAADSPDVAFIVMMAGPGVSGEQILYEQGALIMRAAGAPETEISAQRERQKEMFEIVMKEPDTAAAQKRLVEFGKREFAKLPDAERKALGGEAGMAAQVSQINTPWFRYFLSYDPRTALKRVKCPVLAINGEHDLQVPPKQSLPEIESALKEGGNKDITLKELPGLNHLFQTTKTGSPSEYSDISETISPIALKTMGDWIVAHTGTK